jgi:serine/threonine protein kinase
MELSPGSAFGPYRIDGALGRGGMASVYRAYEESLDRFVALKVLPAELLHDTSFAERFRREARVAAKLEHPHVVPIHAYGIESGRPWMALRLIGGGSLADLVKRERLAPGRAVDILRDVADALDYAHQQGVIHRDVKPHNVLLDERGRAYLADFGIARMLESSSHITATGMIQGTPSYMAPEQVEGKTLGPACDVYALGVVAYECFTGRVPFSGPTPVSILMKHVTTPPPLPSPGEVAPPLTGALHQCLAKEPSERWPTAGAFVHALERGLQGETTATLPAPQSAPSGVPAPTPPASRPPVVQPPVVQPPVGQPSKPPRARRRATGVALSAAAVLVLVGLAAWWAGRASAPNENVPTASLENEPATGAEASAEAPPAPLRTPAPPPASRTKAPDKAPRAGAATPRTTPPPRPAPPTPVVTPEPTPDPTPEPTAAPTLEPKTAPYVEPATTPTPEPKAADPVASLSGAIRVFLDARLERRLFRGSKEKDVTDSARDMREAVVERDGLELADRRTEADAVIVVLERGRKRKLGIPGTRQVRVRVSTGGQSLELVGQDKALGFNTWKGAAKETVRQAEEWVRATLEAR